MKARYLSIPFFFLLFSAMQVYAWNAGGHMLVGEIAYQNLDAPVKAKVDKILGDLHKEYPYVQDIHEAAAWPDGLRSQKIEIFTHWHYVDTAFSSDGTPLKNITDTDNAVWALNKIMPIVQNNRANWSERSRFLAFLIHFVGDIHQPMHAASQISAQNPDGDKGGNLFSLGAGIAKHGKNLHGLWDSGLGEFQNKMDSDGVKAMAKQITTAYPKAFFTTRLDNLSPQDWANESFLIAKCDAYDTLPNQKPSEKYLAKNRELAKQQVALAGYRLASLLNRLLKA
jgi:hypothetical protein